MYQNDWIPALGEVLQCSRKVGNAHDPYAVKVMKAGTMVGHLPKKISSTCSLGKVEQLIVNDGSEQKIL